MSELELNVSKQSLSKAPQYPLLALDYGRKRIGVAISDSKGLIASPLDTLIVPRDKRPNDMLDQISELVNERRAKGILLGLPQVMADAHKRTEDEIKKFADSLQEKVDVPIYFQDESYSTQNAQQLLQSYEAGQKSRRQNIDKMSATLFLQEYLDEQHRTNQSE